MSDNYTSILATRLYAVCASFATHICMLCVHPNLTIAAELCKQVMYVCVSYDTQVGDMMVFILGTNKS